MFDRTVKKVAGLGFAAVALAIVAIPASGLLTVPAFAADDAQHDPAAHAGAAAAALDPARIAKGRELFQSWSCNACHTLADAKANGAVGPIFDGDANLTEEFVTTRVTTGQGAMPAFGGQLSKEEIADLAYYLTKVAAK
ncbi:MAG: cytochrome c [Sphingobium sp.]|nr:cytochrome c [Sphingobium sp.]